ncbi:uncharacterized protein FFUJ_10263 [Fusarium fujikuroi IMI 58289]|uniref:Uncharacterized protein n=1 Tax=Gibberella fujikuroi (strain CBS 195.34 / IMI 58289 / NRRL A-6831) TaxID=1279085 RepID=S0EHT9_GIBF5|nr:uncharacterized protein FFUJ_10263 [Fusarium fujikuroi IMI 58289]CCT74220.1 uncharacterized protein FFUJ_10263 [Fusarium fujikuroi IMI 58289]SCO26398.1 uncharacterized protein FFM5_14667 [Fusarium fujikuroi]SCO58490.1 uncharacterized protein FFMR_15646 [Fusarium fujikuroi]
MTFACHECWAVFVRSEHLQRHMEGHMGMRPFSCGECTASFSRKDILVRHMQIHESPETPPAKQHRTPYVAQACLKCAKSKQRCDGQLPCGRCTSKRLQCSYPPSKSRRATQNTPGSVASQNQGLQNEANHTGFCDQPGLNQQLQSSTESDTTSLSYWPPSNNESMTGLSSQPSLAPDQNIGSVFGVYGDFEWSGPSDAGAFWGLETYLSLGAMPTLSSPSALESSQSLADATPNLQPPASSGPEVGRPETDKLAPRVTQTLESPHSSNGRLSDRSLSATNDCIDPDSDAWRAEDYCHVPRLSEDVYQEMIKHFARYNRDDEYWSIFTSSDFPPITHINTFIQVYFEEFHSLLPFLHKASFAPTKDQWILSLGVAAIGSIFSRVANSSVASFNLVELLRRAIHVQSERVRSSQPDISFVQAVLLNQLGMMFGPETTRIEAVPVTRALLETLCRKTACYTNFDAFCQPLDSENSGEDNWADWIKKESLRRLFYSVWILDCEYNCFWSGLGIVTIDCLQLPAPLHPKLWEAPSQETWKKHKTLHEPVPFGTVLSEFYRTRKIDSSDPFNTLLLIVGVKYHAERLNRAPIYLGILQDHAKTLPPSRLSGAVESLSHLLSMLIYSPVQELYAFSGWRVDTAQRAIVHAKLRTWIQSTSEARTALMHACNAWSMIRRSKTGAQHETMGFLVATLLIWAWIKLGNRPEVDDMDLLLTVRLDEGKDHIKEWINNNEERRLYLGGVGCLWDMGADRRLLQESTNTLDSFDWPAAHTIASILREHYRSFDQVATVSPTT